MLAHGYHVSCSLLSLKAYVQDRSNREFREAGENSVYKLFAGNSIITILGNIVHVLLKPHTNNIRYVPHCSVIVSITQILSSDPNFQ